MSFGNLFSVLASFVSTQIVPTQTSPGFFNFFGEWIGNIFVWLGNAIASLFYIVCKWLLAFVDFLQYFIQKLIGLDYWLNNNNYTLEGATGNDLLFSFLYDDTVQRVFRAMMGIFIVLLIIFTIYQIIKNEWTYITGESFGDGKSNSKAKILRQALKAIVIVIMFPIMLFVGIISSNAILASLVKALNIDMASTFGGTIFSISTQNANRYKQYASSDARTAVSDEVSFYITRGGKYLVLTNGRSGSDSLCEYVNSYQDYLAEAAVSTKYTVNTMFGHAYPRDIFYGYCISLNIDGETAYFMLPCLNPTGSGNAKNSPTAMYYYLRNVLQANIMTRSNNLGNQSLLNDVRQYMSNGTTSNGYIRGADFSALSQNTPVIQACYNSWTYATIYKTTRSFTESLNFSAVYGGTGSFLVNSCHISSVNSAKVMFNSDIISSYFDGGQLGVVQMKAEYQVMGDVMDFIVDNDVTLYMIDATSNLINWTYDPNYQVETRWISTGTTSGNASEKYLVSNGESYLPFVVSYSEECDETEIGNVLYLAKQGENNELYGSKYIMCWKVISGTSTEYIPLVNNMTFTDPVTRNTYRFSSDYLASNYRGVVVAKGSFDFDTKSNNTMLGDPTYIRSSQNVTTGDGEVVAEIDSSAPYYYNLSIASGFTQFVDTEGLNGSSSTNYNSYTIEGVGIESEDYPSTEYNVSPVYGTDNHFEIISNGTAQGLTQNMVSSVTVTLGYMVNGNPRTIIAQFGDDNLTFSDGADRYLLFEVNNNGEYFIVHYNTTYNYFTIRGVNTTTVAADKVNNRIGYSEDELAVGGTLNCAYWQYNIKYATYDGDDKADGIANNAVTLPTVNTSYFEYAYSQNGRSVFRTEEIINISQLNRSSYIYAYFNTTGTHLLSLSSDNNSLYINFADADVGSDFSYTFDQVVLRFDLYNYFTALIGDQLMEATIDANGEASFSTATTPDVDDPVYVFMCKINSSDFDFGLNENSLGLYDGNEYVATVYKEVGTTCSTVNDLISTTTSVLYNANQYANIRTQNYYLTEDNAKTYYENLQSQFIIGCYRDNANNNFWNWDWDIRLFNIRLKISLFVPMMERDYLAQSFRISDGIGYDYFFDGDIVLSTFYIPLRVSYWIMLISCVLIIKVLGTAIWGVIKRFYEITLYYLAMPAMASTIPLDDGQRFNQQIISKLFSKVLGTYGVILGINVFFILLTPVRSLSNIFTAEDIATSGSYFLIHLPFSYRVLNSYVYILFVLVAFTMIDTLPRTISALIDNGKGDGDVLESGRMTKGMVGKQLKDSANMISGKAAIDAIKGGAKTAASFIPGSELMKGAAKAGKKGVDWVRDKHQAKEEAKAESGAETGGGGGSSSSRGDGDEEPEGPSGGGAPSGAPDGEGQGTETGGTFENSQSMAPVNRAVEEQTGVNVAEAHATGDSTSTAVADAAITESGTEFTDEQASTVAASDFNRSAISGNFGSGDNVNIVGNVVRNNLGDQNIQPTINQAIMNHQQLQNDGNLDVDPSQFGMSLTKGQSIRAVNNNGNLEYQVVDESGNQAVGADGQTVTIPPDVVNQITNAILSKIGNEDIKTAAMQTGNMGAIANVFGNNVATGINLSSVGQTDGVLAEQVYNQALQNEDINADAILRHLIKQGDYEDFARSYNIVGTDGNIVDSDKIFDNKKVYGMAIDTIKNQFKSNEANDINRFKPEQYRSELNQSIQAGLQNGTFKVSAWSLQGKEGRQDATNKALAKMDTQGHNILDGATETEKSSILANTARNVVTNAPDGKLAQQIKADVFSRVVGDEDLAKFKDNGVLKAFTGKDDVKDLTEEDKALLGFAKVLSENNADNVDVASASKFKLQYKNNQSKINEAFEKLDNDEIRTALEESGQDKLIARTATIDTSLALSSEQLSKAQDEFIQGLPINAQNKIMDKLKLMDESGKNNYINSLMQEHNFDYSRIVNGSYQKYNGRTADELAAENRLSHELVNDDVTLNAFINGKDIEGKSDVVNGILIDRINSNNVKLNDNLKNNLAEFEGFDEQSILIAQEKAKLMGIKDSEINVNNISDILLNSSNYDEKVLRGLQAEGKGMEMLSGKLDADQIEKLKNSASNNGFVGLNEKEQSEFLAQLANEDGGVKEAFEAYKRKDGNSSASMSEFLNSEDGSEYKNLLTARASELSLYEVKNRMKGDSADKIYADIQNKNKYDKFVNASINSSDITADDIREQMINDNNTYAMREFATTYGEMYSVIDEDEADVIRKQGMLDHKVELLQRIKDKYGEDAFAEKYGAVIGTDFSKADDDAFMNVLTSEMADDSILNYNANNYAELKLSEVNMSRLANGGMARITATANKVRESSRLMKKAREQYVRENLGKEFDDLSEFDQNQYLAHNYGSKLSQDLQDEATEEYLREIGISEVTVTGIKDKDGKQAYKNMQEFINASHGIDIDALIEKEGLKTTQTGSDAYASIIKNLSQEEFNSTYERVSENSDSSTINELKRKYAERRIGEQGITNFDETDSLQPDLDSMSATQRRRFNNNKNLLQQRIRAEGSGETLSNLFRNTKLLNEDKIVLDMVKIQAGKNSGDLEAKIKVLKNNPEFVAKVQQSAKDHGRDGNILLYEAEFKEMAKTATIDELKNGLTNQSIDKYMNSHETTKDKLLNLGANNLTLTLDNDTKNQRNLDAVINSYSLQNEVVNDILNKEYTDKSTLRDEIRKMLQAEGGQFGNMSDADLDKYIDSHEAELQNQFARQRYLTTDKLGNISFNNDVVKNSDVLNSINSLTKTNEMFKNSLYNNVTKNVTSKNATESDINGFFGTGEITDTAHLKGKLSKDEEAPTDVGKAFDRFTKDGFITKAKNGVLFKLTKKLPETSAAYDNWNRLLENKIQLAESKQGVYATMSDEHRKSEIEKMKSQKISQVRPDDFEDMTPEEQRAFKESQTKLKQEALQVKNYGKLYNSQVKVTKPKDRNVFKKVADQIGYSTVGGALARVPVLNAVTGKFVTDNVKLKHKQDLFRANQLVDRYNATSMLRNKDVNFGANFDQFARGYFNSSQFNSMARRYNLASSEKFARMNDSERANEIKKRESAFENELNRIQRVSAKKVAQDEHVKPSTYLEGKGFVTTNVRYKNGSKKFTTVQSEIRSNGKFKGNSNTRRIQAENELISLRNKNDALQNLNSTFKGSREDYVNRLNEILGADVVKNKIGSATLPKSVLMRNALKYVENSEKQYTKRLSSKGLISTSSSVASQFVGKTMTNAKTQREIELDKRRASDINRDLNIFSNQKNLLNFNQLIDKMSPQIIGTFKRNFENNKRFQEMSEEDKKNSLGGFLRNQLDLANSKVHNNNLLKSDADKLQKLNGIYIKKQDLNTSGTSRTVINNMRATNSPVYQNLVKNYNSAHSKYKLEEANLSDLTKRLAELKAQPTSRANRNEIRKVSTAIDSSQIRLGNLKQLVDTAQARKVSYERSFADTQIREARVINRNRGVNVSGSVLDRYDFPMRRPGGGPPMNVRPGTMDARMLNRIVFVFMMRYRAYLERMIRSFQETDKNLYKQLNDSFKKLSNDFGANIRSLKSTQRKLDEQMRSYKNKNDEASKKIKTQLKDHQTQLKTTEEDLIKQLKNMGIEINEIKLKKQ